MTNKKLIFVVGCSRSGTTLLLSFLCGLPDTKVLYETKLLSKIFTGHPNGLKLTDSQRTLDPSLVDVANYFDSFSEETIIEKTPEHVNYLELIEDLRRVCKRDIYVVYVVRPPVPTILSIIKASKDSPELFGDIDLLGACEKYEQSLLSIYTNLILKTNRPNSPIVEIPVYGRDILNDRVKISSYKHTRVIPYSFCVAYRELIHDPYRVLNTLMNLLYLKGDIQSLLDNRISNIAKYLPLVSTEKHHVNVSRDIQEVEVERRSCIAKQITEGFSESYKEKSKYIRNYFDHPITKESLYDLVAKKKVLQVMDNPEVYVIVPLYNKQDYIEETLRSLADQTYKNVRVITIDDFSTDNSADVAEKFVNSLDPQTRKRFSVLRYDRNTGVSFIRNKGLSICTDIITFCDADDIWDKNLIQRSVDTFTKYPYVDCVYSRVSIKKGDKIIKLHSKISNGKVFLDAIDSNILNCGSNLFIKTSFLDDKDIRFDESLTNVEDWEFLIQLAKEGAAFKCTKEYFVIYRQTPDSATKDRVKQLNCSKKILHKYLFERSSITDLPKRKKMFRDSFTRRFCFYFSFKNIRYDHLKDLDYNFIMKVVVNKLKSFAKSCLPKTS